MKKGFTLLFGILFSISLIGQQSVRNNLSQTQDRLVKNDTKHHHYHKYNNEPAIQLKSTGIVKYKLDSTITFNYDEATGKWENGWIDRFTYDANGQNIKNTYAIEWDETESRWGYSDESWVEEYSYDTNNNRTIYLSLGLDESTGNWENQLKNEYTYDESNLITSEISCYNWNNDTKDWGSKSKYEYLYNSNGKIVLRNWYSWQNASWVYNSKYESTYDTNGNETIWISYWRANNTDPWEPNSKYEYAYDTNNNAIMCIGYDWDSSTSQWILDYKNESTYNNSYSLNEIIFPQWWGDEFSCSNMPVSCTELFYQNENWVFDSKDEYYYSEVTSTGTTNTKSDKANVFPNPAKEIIHFTWEGSQLYLNVNIYDVNGNRVGHCSITKGSPVSVAHLSKGIYFYKLVDEIRTVHTGKFCVQ